MEKAIRLLFNLYPGEGRKAFLFIVLGLLWSIGSYGTFTLSEGLFLERVGAHYLPYAYFAIAGGMCLLSSALIFALNRFSIRKLLLALITCWICVDLALYFFLFSFGEADSFWFIYKIIGWIIPLSTYIIYWAFIDQYFDLQDGKRFFCLFNSITFLGDALGGGLISFCLESLGVQGLLLLFAGSMALSLPFILLITKKVSPLLEEGVEHSDTAVSISIREVIKAIFRSPFALYLILFYFAMQLLAVTTEYNYMEAFGRAFSSDASYALTEFVGTCGMWISLGNMLFAMLCYSRLVKKMGLTNVLLIAPSFFLLLFSFWMKLDILSIAIFGMIAREGLVYTLDDNHLPLLLSAVPNKVKNQVRVTIESFIEPIGILTGAFLLLMCQNQHKTLGLSLALVALIVALFLRGHYGHALFKNLVIQSLRFEKKATDWIAQFTHKEKKQTEFILLSQLKKPDEQGQLIAYEYLLKLGDIRLLPRLLNHMGKLTLPGKVKVIELLRESPWAKEPLILERLERWRRILPHPAIKSSIHFYFARHSLLRPEKIMQDLHHEHLGLRAAAILTMKTAPYATQLPTFCSIAAEKLKQLLGSDDELEICMGLKILTLDHQADHVPQILPFLEYPSLQVKQQAAIALAACATVEGKKWSLKSIHYFSATKDPLVRQMLLNALEKFACSETVKDLILACRDIRLNERAAVEQLIVKMGKKIGPLLLELTRDHGISDRSRLLAGRILGKIDLKMLQAHLPHIIYIEIERAYFYFYHAEMIQKQVPEQDLSILQSTLKNSFESILDLIIQLLGAAKSLNESEILAYSLKSKNRKMRATALESLEKACGGKIFSLLEPLLDDRQIEIKLHAYLKGGRVPMNLPQLLDLMSRSPSPIEKLVALGMRGQQEINYSEEYMVEPI